MVLEQLTVGSGITEDNIEVLISNTCYAKKIGQVKD